MTLVEVVMAMFVFAVVVLGAFGVLTFGLRTMDASRAFTQASQILTHEMEAMRLRSFDSDDAGINQKSVKYLCDHASDYASFTAFADYRGGDVAVGNTQPVLGKDVLGETRLQLRNATGFTCRRSLGYTNADKDQILISLSISWTDNSRITHSRRMSSTVSKNGLNDSIFLIN